LIAIVELRFDKPASKTKTKISAIFFLINNQVIMNNKRTDVITGNPKARKVIGQNEMGLINGVQQLNR
jgi:hypothetical protein